MSFFGKFFIVLVLFMSVLFMTFALVVNRTHRDWKAEADELASEVSAAQQENTELVDQQKKLDQQLMRERISALNQLRKLEYELVVLRERNEVLRNQAVEMKDARSEATGEVAKAQEENLALAQQVEQLRGEFGTNRQARDQAFVDALSATEQLHDLQGKLESTLERNRQLSSNR